MTARAAIVTGASSGIGLEVVRMLCGEGFGVTLSARRPDKLEAAVAELAGAGLDVQGVAGDVSEEAVVQRVVAAHRERFGRLDVLVNNAGIGIGAPVAEIETKHLDLQLGVNLRSAVLFYREAAEMLREAGAEHRNALVVNMSSISGKRGVAWISTYSATKAGLVAWTEAMNRELGGDGVKSTALCPALVATEMSAHFEHLAQEDLIRTTDVAEAVRFLLRTSPGCVVPEIMFVGPGTAEPVADLA